MDKKTFTVPEEHELVAFFGVEPTEKSEEDGFWSYEVETAYGMFLRFSFDLYEGSVQTELRVGEAVIASVSHELAQTLTVDANTLRCTFCGSGQRTALLIDSKQRFCVSWSTLRE